MSGVEWWPQSRIDTPKDGGTVYVDHWWVTMDQTHLGVHVGGTKLNPTYAPQVNRQKWIAEKLGATLYPGSSVRFLPVAYLPRSAS